MLRFGHQLSHVFWWDQQMTMVPSTVLFPKRILYTDGGTEKKKKKKDVCLALFLSNTLGHGTYFLMYSIIFTLRRPPSSFSFKFTLSQKSALPPSQSLSPVSSLLSLNTSSQTYTVLCSHVLYIRLYDSFKSTTRLWSRCFYYLHVTDEQTKAQRDEKASSRSYR